jgi:hypothetical protein
VGVRRSASKKWPLLSRRTRSVCSRRWQREQSVTRSSSKLDPATAWWTESLTVEPQRTQRFSSRSRAARRSRCHAERLSSGREEPERCGVAQRAHRPLAPAARTAPQPGQARASVTRSALPREEPSLPCAWPGLPVLAGPCRWLAQRLIHKPLLFGGEVVVHGSVLSVGQPPRVSARRWARVRRGVRSWAPTHTLGRCPLRIKP